MPARRAIHPAVESPAQTVRAELLVAGGEAAHEHLARVGFAIAVGVAEKKHVGRGGDDDDWRHLEFSEHLVQHGPW